MRNNPPLTQEEVKHIIERADELLWRNVIKTDTCWEWRAYGLKDGCYGSIQLQKGSKHYGAHRISWVIHFGDIPANIFVCHKCDNRRCVRPDHLFLGTLAENMRDMFKKGRAFSQTHPELIKRNYGEDSPVSILTWKSVDEIRAKYSTGNYTYKELGLEYGTHKDNVGDVIRGFTWKTSNRPMGI